MQQNSPVTLGCDPELFLFDSATHEVISAHDVIPAEKAQPEPVILGAIQHDGLALEFNISPAASLKEWLNNISAVMGSLENRIKQHSPNFEFSITPSHKFLVSYVKTLPPEVQALGCSPDFNAYSGKENDSPNPPIYRAESGNRVLRTAAGHIHIGWTDEVDPWDKTHFADCTKVTKQLDCALGSLAPIWDNDKLRQVLYGKKGTFRPKSYGVEYRVLSNRWLANKQMQAWVYMATQHAMSLLDEGIELTEDTTLHIMSPKLCHDRLVREYKFPPLPKAVK